MTPDSSARSFASLNNADLERLSELAEVDHRFFTRRDGHPEYGDRRVAVVLAQGAALHYIDGETGIKDFDVWTFYATLPGRTFNFGVRKTDVDFGPSRHGRNLYPPEFDRPELPRWLTFAGRRVDFMIRGLPVTADASLDDVVRALRRELVRGAAMPRPRPKQKVRWNRWLAQKAMVVIDPSDARTRVVWDVRAEHA